MEFLIPLLKHSVLFLELLSYVYIPVCISWWCASTLRQSENLQYYFFLTALLFFCIFLFVGSVVLVRKVFIFIIQIIAAKLALLLPCDSSFTFACEWPILVHVRVQLCRVLLEQSYDYMYVIPIWCMFPFDIILIPSVFSFIILYELSQLECFTSTHVLVYFLYVSKL